MRYDQRLKHYCYFCSRFLKYLDRKMQTKSKTQVNKCPYKSKRTMTQAKVSVVGKQFSAHILNYIQVILVEGKQPLLYCQYDAMERWL
jgi:hypothetical protein